MVVEAKKKWVYSFGDRDNATRKMRGNKGFGLAEMTAKSYPIPPGKTIITEASKAFSEAGNQLPNEIWEETLEAVRDLEKTTGKKLGDPNDPLLVSVRSGAPVSMPGMMDTILNLGITDESAKGLAAKTNNERFANDVHRRFIQMFGHIAMGVNKALFENKLEEIKKAKGVFRDTDLDADDLKQAVNEFKSIIRKETGKDIPSDPIDQLKLAVSAVFESWNGKRAVTYREANNIPHDLGTAVNIQAMVFGNMGEASGTGVAFTRDNATGEKVLSGDYVEDGQGEDVVAGIRNTSPITELEELFPEIYEELSMLAGNLERDFRDMQDIEFTVEEGKVWLLQTRSGKRSAIAAVKIALDMVGEGLISEDEALMRVTTDQVTNLLHHRFDPKEKAKALSEGRLLAIGIAASPGAATGKIIFDSDRAKEASKKGEKTVLGRPETSPDDYHGMISSEGIVTSKGGRTSHAAVIATGAGKPAVVGAEALKINLEEKEMRIGEKTIHEGDWISLDGETGEIFAGEITTITPDIKDNEDLLKFLEIADKRARLQVWANADNPRDAKKALEFGAKGIGLCRTEHMFFEDRRPIMQKMILSVPEAHKGNKEAKKEYDESLSQLLSIQRGDFKGILEVMDGKPVIIRLLDIPLDEILPNKDDLLVKLTRMEERGEVESADYIESKKMLGRVISLSEKDPMMGLRGVRLGITMPDVYEMQIRAIFEAACELKREGMDPRPEIMIPLVSYAKELSIMNELVKKIGEEVMKEQGMEVGYKFGSMIETPRAALIADKLAKEADFSSFGTNDLTQMSHGVSRDDSERGFLVKYVDEEILPESPFASFDEEGSGQLIKMAVEKARSVKPYMKIGVCGEQGGDSKSIVIFDKLGLDYVSASPHRVPIARLAAAQAQILYERNKA